MGVKLVVYKDAEPEIGIVFDWEDAELAGLRAQGWHGRCTQCGKTMHFWTQERAMSNGQTHVDRH